MSEANEQKQNEGAEPADAPAAAPTPQKDPVKKWTIIVLVACGSTPGDALATEAAAYYLVAYTITTLAAFTLLGLLSLCWGLRGWHHGKHAGGEDCR